MENTQEIDFQETKARFIWVGVVVGFLVMQICISAVAVVLAMGNPSTGVVDDYYQQGLSWDEMKEAQLKSDALNWSLVDPVITAGDVFGNRHLQITLKTNEGAPVAGCQITGKLYHHAAANKVIDVTMTESQPGTYFAEVQMRRTGLWAFKLVAEHEQGTFLHTEDIRLKD